MRVLLETERLILRRFAEADENDLFGLHNDPDVMYFLNGGKPTPREVIRTKTLPRFLDYDDRFDGFGYWAAIEKSTGDFLGWFAFRPLDREHPHEVELGYRLRKSVWGKGYATEGSRALIRKGFSELGVRRVFAQTMAVNLASRRVMQKSGLTLARTFFEEWPDYIEGAEHGDVEYALEKADWDSFY